MVVTQTSNGYHLAITDVVGTTEVDLTNGQDGATGATGPRGEQGPKGDIGAAFTYEDFTPAQLEALTGPQGPKGDTGEQGPAGTNGTNGTNGTDGITPTVTVTAITGGHNVAFDYGSGDARNTNFDVMDGEGGSGGSYTAGTGIDITNGVISVSFPIAEEGEF